MLVEDYDMPSWVSFIASIFYISVILYFNKPKSKNLAKVKEISQIKVITLKTIKVILNLALLF